MGCFSPVAFGRAIACRFFLKRRGHELLVGIFVRDFWRTLQSRSSLVIPWGIRGSHVSVSDPTVLQQSADYMRMLLAGTDSLGETQRGEIRDHMARLQAARDGLVQGLWRRSTQAFAVHTLIHALLLADFFTSQEHMREGVKHSLRLAINDSSVADYFVKRLETPGVLPSTSVLNQHRFGLVLAYFHLLQQEHKIGLDEGGYVIHRTVDSSPQGGHDWVLHGYRCIRADKIVKLFRLAHEFILRADEPGYDSSAVTAIFEAHLRMVQGMPCAVASGRCSLLHKLHAIVHSTRLYCPSWLATVAFMSQTYFCRRSMSGKPTAGVHVSQSHTLTQSHTLSLSHTHKTPAP